MESCVVVGLGSMGRRRIRCLLRLGFSPDQIIGVDLLESRRVLSSDCFGVRVLPYLSDVFNVQSSLTFAIISTPPDAHSGPAHDLINLNIPVFIEADVLKNEVEKILNSSPRAPNLCYPSCSMRFFSGPRLIKEYVEGETLGRPINWIFHSTGYLPDWHPWESIHDYYVSNFATSGVREIVPFEFSWISWIFGDVNHVSATIHKALDLGADINDLYQVIVEFDSGVHGALCVDTVGRLGGRSFRLNLSEGSIFWDSHRNVLEIYSVSGRSEQIDLGSGNVMHNEESIYDYPYVLEIEHFLSFVRGQSVQSLTLEDSIGLLDILDCIESSAKLGKSVMLGN